MLPAPYLLYLGNETDSLAVKTSRGLAQWRPDVCLGQYRREGSRLSIGLPDMSFEQAAQARVATLVLGIANAGGVLGPDIIEDVVAALGAGLNVASGLHARLRDQPTVVAAAERARKRLFDVRDPPTGLPIGTGAPRRGRRLLTIGTDCSVGKMYATLALERAMRSRGMLADFRATGQTGILIAGVGVPVDAVVADFISGSVECLSPARKDGGWDLIEGQGSLFHPSYAGVSLGLLHGAQPDALVLCHESGREHMRGLPGRALPDLAVCLEANLQAAKLTNPRVQAVGIALNTSRLGEQEARRACQRVADTLGLPCQDPIRDGVSLIVDRLAQCFEMHAPAKVSH
jgi:uncharacterized NAD-dependent epimerase/dehydratase family protein